MNSMMSSSAADRLQGATNGSSRAPRFGELQSTGVGGAEERSSQSNTYGQAYGSRNAWQTNSGIWGTGTIGSGYGSSTRETSRSRAEDESIFKGVSGLTATSEVDVDTPWAGPNNRPWNVDKTSPTSTSHSGSTSPVRHRGSIANASGAEGQQQSSSYITSSRTAIGQGAGLSARANLSGLNPASGTFKYPISSGLGQAFSDNKENLSFRRGSVDNDEASRRLFEHRGSTSGAVGNQGLSSRGASLAPSRASDEIDVGNSSAQLFSSGSSTNLSGYEAPIFPQSNLSRPTMSGRSESASSQGRGTSHQGTAWEMGMSSLSLGMRTAQNNHAASPANDPYPSNAWRGQTNVGSSLNDQLGTYGSFSHQIDLATNRALNQQPTSPTPAHRSAGSPSYPSNTLGSTTPISHSGSRSTNGFDPIYRQQPPHPYFQPQMYAQYGADQLYGQQHMYDFGQSGVPNFRGGANVIYGQPAAASFNPGFRTPRGPARDQRDAGHGTRSMLLEEFRCNTRATKKYELKDIFGYIVEFAGDQHGSRFIQDKLIAANSDEKEQVFHEIQPNALQLMSDIFGNYVIQKLFEHGNQIQKRVLADQMRNHVAELSVQPYGCRVVQKALEFVLVDQQIDLVKELRNDVVRICKDANGNHVIQKAIERLPNQNIRFIIDAFKGQIQVFATHNYACRVIQRILEFGTEQDQAFIIEEIFACLSVLVLDQYGNYVVQHIITSGKPEDRKRIVEVVMEQALTLSKHKFASNVVERCYEYGNEEQRLRIQGLMTGTVGDGSSTLLTMMKDQYANYVIQKMLLELQGDEWESLAKQVRVHVNTLKQYNNGKQLATFERILNDKAKTMQFQTDSQVNANSTHSPTISNKATGAGLASAAPTPMLTTEQNSPQSSNTPSTSASTADGPITTPPRKLSHATLTIEPVHIGSRQGST